MDKSRATLEVIAQTVDDAIQKGLNELGLPREVVDVEVLDEGSQGVFGIGSRQARVRISLKTPGAPPEKETKEEPVPEEELEEPSLLALVEQVVSELLERMNISADISAQFGEKSDNLPYRPIKVDITGKDLSMLIGKRGKTLNALQYVTRLILGKELERGIPLTIDVEGYRHRREIEVRQIAQRVAQQVAKTQRHQALEPMPPNERRFAHLELRDHPDVYTESTGEDPNRKVVVYPKH
ncbi:MAG: RNA-binding cell elongation regulator Jag/EloR [Anaerolineales bacterium]